MTTEEKEIFEKIGFRNIIPIVEKDFPFRRLAEGKIILDKSFGAIKAYKASLVYPIDEKLLIDFLKKTPNYFGVILATRWNNGYIFEIPKFWFFKSGFNRYDDEGVLKYENFIVAPEAEIEYMTFRGYILFAKTRIIPKVSSERLTAIYRVMSPHSGEFFFEPHYDFSSPEKYPDIKNKIIICLSEISNEFEVVFKEPLSFEVMHRSKPFQAPDLSVELPFKKFECNELIEKIAEADIVLFFRLMKEKLLNYPPVLRKHKDSLLKIAFDLALLSRVDRIL